MAESLTRLAPSADRLRRDSDRTRAEFGAYSTRGYTIVEGTRPNIVRCSCEIDSGLPYLPPVLTSCDLNQVYQGQVVRQSVSRGN